MFPCRFLRIEHEFDHCTPNSKAYWGTNGVPQHIEIPPVRIGDIKNKTERINDLFSIYLQPKVLTHKIFIYLFPGGDNFQERSHCFYSCLHQFATFQHVE